MIHFLLTANEQESAARLIRTCPERDEAKGILWKPIILPPRPDAQKTRVGDTFILPILPVLASRPTFSHNRLCRSAMEATMDDDVDEGSCHAMQYQLQRRTRFGRDVRPMIFYGAGSIDRGRLEIEPIYQAREHTAIACSIWFPCFCASIF